MTSGKGARMPKSKNKKDGGKRSESRSSSEQSDQPNENQGQLRRSPRLNQGNQNAAASQSLDPDRGNQADMSPLPTTDMPNSENVRKQCGTPSSTQEIDKSNGQQQPLRRLPRLHQGNQQNEAASASNLSSGTQSKASAEKETSKKPIKTKPDNKTCLAYEERCMRHKCSSDHPERPERIERIFAQLNEEGLVDRCIRVESRSAKLDEILLVHDETYVKELASTKNMEIDDLRTWQDKWNSIYANYDTWDAAILACGNLLECVDAVVEDRALNGVAVIRPPGHHAESDMAYGFCFINNVAVAAQYARKFHGIDKILILDWDVHHGNGIQSAFWTNPSVLYISLHRYDHGAFFPRNEQNNYMDVGEGAGRGFNVNIPWNGKGFGDAEYLEAFKKIVMPIATEFKPDLVFVSAGFDAARGDPLGGYRVTPHGYSQMTSMLSALANGRIILALEGGYNLTSISASMAACVHVLLGDDPIGPDDAIKPCAEAARKTIKDVISVLREFWTSLRTDSVESVRAAVENMRVVDEIVEDAGQNLAAIEQFVKDTQEELRIRVSTTCQAAPSKANKSATKSTTGLIFEEVVLSRHYCLWQPQHIECPARLATSLNKIRERGLVERCVLMEPRKADVSEVCSYHDIDFVEKLAETANWDEMQLEIFSAQFNDVYVNSHSYESALIAAGSTIDGVKAVLEGRVSNSMILIRPPGHHAMKAEINGFCIFNNVVIATKMALETYKLKRILIVDWDVHHGQGTQRAFYDDPRVLYFSIHRFENGTFWPNLRESHRDYIGEGDGEGFNVNAPLNKIGVGDAEYLSIFNHILLPLATDFDPELIIISAGYDAAIGCPEGRMEVSPLCYGHLTRMLMSLANGRMCVVLEGGYCLDSLAEGVAITLRALLGDYCPKVPAPIKKPIEPLVTEVLLNLAHHLKGKWPSMRAMSTAVNGVLNKLERPPYTPTTPVYSWTPPSIETGQETTTVYAVHSSETVQHYHELVEKMMSRYSLEPIESKLIIGYQAEGEEPKLIKRLKAETSEDGCSFLDVEKLAKDMTLVHQSGLTSSLTKQVTCDGVMHQSGKDVDDAVAAFEICLNALEGVQKRSAQSALVILNETCAVDPTTEIIRYAQKHGLKRLLVIDFHEQCRDSSVRSFYEDDFVLYISMHRNDSWARTDHGQPENTGRGLGAGYNVNLVWNGKAPSDSEDLFALYHIILPLAYSFDPDLVVIYSEFTKSAAGDSGSNSPVYASPAFFAYFVHQLQMLAEGKLLLFMKGDYTNDDFGVRASACVETLLRNRLPVHQRLTSGPVSSNVVLSYMETVFYLRPYWPYLQCVLAPNPDRGGAMETPVGSAASVAEYMLLQQQLGNIDSVFVGIPSAHCPHTAGNGVCATVPSVSEINMAAPCEVCGNIGENWICLTCWMIHCSRHINEHALLHSTATGHPISLSMADLSAWCYICDNYIISHVVMPAKRALHLAKFGVEMPS